MFPRYDCRQLCADALRGETGLLLRK